VQQRDEAFALLLGLPAPGLEDLEPEAARRRVHDAVGAWLLALADEQPVVLVVDDIHWADASSRALITDLTVLTQQAPVALVLSGRPEARALLGELPLHELHLIALADAEIGDLVATVLGGEAPPELALFVAARSGGNPFFAQELVRSLQERDALAHQQGAWRMRPGWDERTLPLTVENVLSARIDLLPPALADVLQTAAVVGRVARLSLLREVAQVQLDDSVAGLCEHGLLLETLDRAEPAVAFPHALVQDAAYSRLLRKRRRELHLRVAEVSERLYGSGDDVVDLLARHLYLGAAGTKAVELLRRAAARAARLFANDEAILHLKRALELDPDDVSIRLDLADLHELVGAYDDALDLFESARGGSQDVRAWRGIAAILRKRGDYERSLASVDVALRVDALAGEDLTPLWLEQGWTLSVLGRLDEARDVLERALIASDGARTRVVAQTLLQLARAETVAGRYEVALERAFEARSIFAEVDDVPGLATTSRILGDTLRRLDRLDEAAAELRAGLEAAERTGSVEEIGGCLINLALVEHQRGAFEEAVACDHRAIAEFERSGHASGRAQGYANLAWKLAGTGAADEATVYCEKALELAHALGLSLTVADVYDTMASIALGTGDAAAAGARAEEAASLYLQVGAVPQAAGSLELAAQAWEVAGETDRAGGARARLGELAAGSVSPV
jgi:tetratricopeptide (TPR) repeat protein